MGRQLEPCGTVAAYQRHIRNGEQACQACRWAAALRSANQRIERAGRADVPHGTVSGYCNWGCRCEKCTKAQTNATRERRRYG